MPTEENIGRKYMRIEKEIINSENEHKNKPQNVYIYSAFQRSQQNCSLFEDTKLARGYRKR